MEGDGRRIVYPPIHEVTNRWGDLIYQVVLSDRTQNIDLGGGLSREEAHQRVREILLHGLRDGRYLARDFYPEREGSQRYVASHAGYRLDVEETPRRRCSSRIPASGEAMVNLLETSMKDGECSVCLEDFKTGSKLRMMPCSHSFHEECIFNWLRLNHVCPLCRFSLPTKQQEDDLSNC